MNWHGAGLLLAGPTVVAVLTASLAVLTLVSGAIGRLDRLADLGRRASARLTQRLGLLPLWGLAALLLALLVSAVLFHIKPLGLLGVAVLLAGLALLGLGLGAAAVRVGRALAAALGSPASDTLTTLRLGLAAFFVASLLPVLGWLVVFMAALAGLGATLEALFRRDL